MLQNHPASLHEEADERPLFLLPSRSVLLIPDKHAGHQSQTRRTSVTNMQDISHKHAGHQSQTQDISHKHRTSVTNAGHQSQTQDISHKRRTSVTNAGHQSQTQDISHKCRTSVTNTGHRSQTLLQHLNTFLIYHYTVLLNNLPEIVKEKLTTRSTQGFVKYVKLYFLQSYEVTCTRQNCYVCMQNSQSKIFIQYLYLKQCLEIK